MVRAFTCFLCCLMQKVIAFVLVLKVTHIAPCELSSWGAECIGEVDCKEQFGRIRPDTTVAQLKEASQFPYHRRRWGAPDIIWSVHQDCKRLDRAGKAASAFRMTRGYKLCVSPCMRATTFGMQEHFGNTQTQYPWEGHSAHNGQTYTAWQALKT